MFDTEQTPQAAQLAALVITNEIDKQIAELSEPERIATLARLLGREAARIRVDEGLEPRDRPTALEEGCAYAADRMLNEDEAPPEAWLNVATGILAMRVSRSYPEYVEEITSHAAAMRLLRAVFGPEAGAGVQVNG